MSKSGGPRRVRSATPLGLGFPLWCSGAPMAATIGTARGRKDIIASVIRVANAPCSWGILEFPSTALGTSPSTTLGTGPAASLAPFTQVLDEIAACGYNGTELGDWGFMPTDPIALADAIAARGLTLIGAFVPVALANQDAHRGGIAAAVRTARLMRDAGASDAFVVLSDDNATVPLRERHAGRIAADQGLDRQGWSTFASGAELVAHAVRSEAGLRTVFHPHCGGYVETSAEIEQLMSRTESSLLGLVLDTGHIVYGGGDPLDIFARYGSRVWHVHFKDCQPAVAARARDQELGYFEAVRNQVFCELGAGTVDFAAIVTALQRHDYDGWIVVEQDVFPGCGTPLASATRSRTFLRQLGL
jgi:inosose dehydratase